MSNQPNTNQNNNNTNIPGGSSSNSGNAGGAGNTDNNGGNNGRDNGGDIVPPITGRDRPLSNNQPAVIDYWELHRKKPKNKGNNN